MRVLLLAPPMVSQLALRYRRVRMLAPPLALGVALLTLAAACDKVPLLAPSGTVITIFPANTTVPLNGEVEIIATVIENGTTAAPPSTGNGTPTTGTPPTGTTS